MNANKHVLLFEDAIIHTCSLYIYIYILITATFRRQYRRITIIIIVHGYTTRNINTCS